MPTIAEYSSPDDTSSVPAEDSAEMWRRSRILFTCFQDRASWLR